MFSEIKETYATSARFVRALPLIAALPVLAEAAQHVAEWRIGMYDSLAQASAVEAHPLRMGFGYVKTAALLLICYWVWRYFGLRGDTARARRLEAGAVASFVPVVLFGVVMMMIDSRLGEALGAVLPGGGAQLLAIFGVVFALMAFELLFAPWKVASALDNRRLDMGRSLAIMRGSFGWSFAFLLAMFLPLMILHYLLGGFAIGAPPAVSAALLVVDCLVVGALAVVLPATDFMLARRAAAKRGVDLAEQGAGLPRAVPARA
ncbi:MAG TPA: hypothetical protein VMG08_13835 [Allosphingosinicella sp.]|nr:hypothetical protein [Allosphingosinicella sp.]